MERKRGPLNDDAASATIVSCVANLMNTIIGSGMLGLPGAFAGSGTVQGTFLLLLAAIFSFNGLRLMSASAIQVGITPNRPSSFYRVTNAAIPRFTFLIDLAVSIKCFGVATGYFITISDALVDVARFAFRGLATDHGSAYEVLTARQFWVLAGFVGVLPFSFFKTLDALKVTSVFSVIFAFGLAVGIVLYAEGVLDPCTGGGGARSLFDVEGLPQDERFLQQEAVCGGTVQSASNFSSTLQVVGIFIFSFTCQQNIFPVVSEMKGRTPSRLRTVFVAAIGLSLILYLLVGLEGYRTYGDDTKGNLLLNYPKNLQVSIMRFLIAIVVTLTYPMQLDPGRRSMLSLIYSRGSRSIEQASLSAEGIVVDDAESDDKTNADSDDRLLVRTTQNLMFNVVTVTFLCASCLIALCVDDLGIVLELVGATGSTLVRTLIH